MRDSAMVELVIRMWRVTRGVPSGSHVWFDPSCEAVKLYRIPLHEQQQATRSDEGLADRGENGELDRVVSMGASEPGQASGDS